MKNSKTPTIFVLGAKGMIGSQVYRLLKQQYPKTTWGTDRTDKKFLLLDAKEPIQYLSVIHKKNPSIDYIINCIGILRQDIIHHKQSIKDAIVVNALFPHILTQWANNQEAKIIHISTDAIYASTTKIITENNQVMPNDEYSASKYLGEVLSDQVLNIRTSCLGLDSKGNSGLLQWIINTKQKIIPGYTKQIWSGCTTIQLAKLCAYLVEENYFFRLRKVTGVLNFTPIQSVSKYEILKEFIAIKQLPISIHKETTLREQRKMDSKYNYTVPIDKTDIRSALIELVNNNRIR